MYTLIQHVREIEGMLGAPRHHTDAVIEFLTGTLGYLAERAISIRRDGHSDHPEEAR